MMRLAVAVLFLASVVAAGVVDARQEDGADRIATAGTSTSAVTAATTTTTAPPTTSVPEATTTTAVPTTTLPPVTPATTAAAPVPVPAGDVKVLVTPKGVVVPVTGREASGYRVTTPCGRSAVVAEGTPVTDATVVLDAGHGGVEPGAVSPSGLPEKGINLAVVNSARAALEKAGVHTVRTRTADYRVTIATRTAIAKALNPKAFVSVHHNAEPDGPRAGPGSETYYQIATPESKRLAGLIYEEVVKALTAYQVPWVADTDAGAKYRTNVDGDDYYGILRNAHGVTSALAELAFVSNPPEADLLSRPDVQQAEGEAVARAILRFLTTRDPGSGFTEPYPRTSPAGGGGGSSNCVDPPL
ncbi:MAG TPA: N-acetylmuramoyl-L-alanine amidase [Acidimicrobiales bacterium]|nr:N-acetylmuramoyl-L-alanine amidase [Acidimicrobiales bacterium]